MFLVLLLSGIPFSSASSQEPLRPDSLLNWLKIIKLEGYDLISACDQNGFYFAVKVDADGDILFADYEHTRDPLNRRNPRGFSRSVTDEDGKELFDWDSKKRSPESKEVEYSSEKRLGPAKVSRSVTVAYSTGRIYPLIDRSSKRIRIRYLEELDEGKSKVLFDHWIVMPNKVAK